MRCHRRRNPLLSLVAVAFASVIAAVGCAERKAISSSVGETPPHSLKAEIPGELEIALRLFPGQAWKSRFVSTSEVAWTMKGADGREQPKSHTFGLELIATQKVAAVDGKAARIQVDESSARILRDGKFLDAPFRQFGPPTSFAFTVDTATGKLDFSEMEKAYADWMAEVMKGPAADILGKNFLLDAYVAQLGELYGRPFTRHSGKKLSKGSPTSSTKDFLLPFLGPRISLGAIPAETSSWIETMEISREKGEHFLKIAGKYGGKKEMSPGELSALLSEFGAEAPAEFQSSAEITGRFDSTLDVMTGREVSAASQFIYSCSASWTGTAVSGHIAGKAMLEPAD